jgi:hypothetical protein
LCILGALNGRVVRAQRTPGVVDLILRTDVQHVFEDISIIRATLFASVLRGRGGWLLATLALDHDALWAPFIDLAPLHILNLVVGYETFDHLRHCVLLSLGSKKNAPFRMVAIGLTTRRPTAIAASD